MTQKAMVIAKKGSKIIFATEPFVILSASTPTALGTNPFPQPISEPASCQRIEEWQRNKKLLSAFAYLH